MPFPVWPFARPVSPQGGGASSRSVNVVNGTTGVVATVSTGLKAPITVTRESGSTAITFAASGNRITASIAAALAVGASLSAIARAVQTDGAGVLIPVTLTGITGSGGGGATIPVALGLSGLLTTGLASRGVSSGDPVSTTVAGLALDTSAITYTFDGTALAGTTTGGLVSATTSADVTVLAANTGNLRFSGRQFFVGRRAHAMISAGYTQQTYLNNNGTWSIVNAGSVLSVTSDDGTPITIGQSSQGFPLGDFTFATAGIKTLTITETPPTGSPIVSTVQVVVDAVPTPPTISQLRARATKLVNARSNRVPLAVGASPPTITINRTGNSFVAGRAIANDGTTLGTAVPDAIPGYNGVTNGAGLGTLYANTTNGTLAFVQGTNKRFRFTGRRFDWKTGTSGNGCYVGQAQINYRPAGTGPWYKATAKATTWPATSPAIDRGVFWFDVDFGTVADWDVEIISGEGVGNSGFNFPAGANVTAIADDQPVFALWNDSFAFGQGAADACNNTPCRVLAEYFGSQKALNFGHRTNAYTRVGGSTGVMAYATDRVGSNPFGFDELTRYGQIDVAVFHSTVNDHTISNFTAIGLPPSPTPTGSTFPLFNNAGGSNSFVAGTTMFTNMMELTFRRTRKALPTAFIVYELGFTTPDTTAPTAIYNASKAVFATVFDTDPGAILVDVRGGVYRWMGTEYTIPGFTAPLIPLGAVGSSPYAPYQSTTFTGSIDGPTKVLTVTSPPTNPIQVGMSTGTASQGHRIYEQLSGTPGGIGDYLLQSTAGSVASSTMTFNGDWAHLLDVGYVKMGEEDGAGVLKLAELIAAS